MASATTFSLCRGGYFNFLQQPHFSLPPQLCENFHFVGLSNNPHPPSPAPPPHGTTIQTEKNSIEIDDDSGVAASRPVKKRYWTHDEEVRLVKTQLPLFPYDFAGRSSFILGSSHTRI